MRTQNVKLVRRRESDRCLVKSLKDLALTHRLSKLVKRQRVIVRLVLDEPIGVLSRDIDTDWVRRETYSSGRRTRIRGQISL